MSRGALLVIVIVLILAIIGVGLALFWKPGFLNGNANTQNTNTAVSNTNTLPAVNAGLTNFTANVENTKTINQTIQYRGADIPLDRVEVTNGYTGYAAAPAGKKYVTVFFQKQILQQKEDIHFWMADEIKLVDGDGNSYSYDRAQLVSKATMDAGGQTFFSFLVPDSASGFKLRFVRPEEDKSVDLGL